MFITKCDYKLACVCKKRNVQIFQVLPAVSNDLLRLLLPIFIYLYFSLSFVPLFFFPLSLLTSFQFFYCHIKPLFNRLPLTNVHSSFSLLPVKLQFNF